MHEHVADLIAAFHGPDVPGEGNQVAPVAFRSEHSYGGVEIARRKRGFKLVEENLDARAKHGVEHRFLPDVVCNCSAQRNLTPTIAGIQTGAAGFPVGFSASQRSPATTSPCPPTSGTPTPEIIMKRLRDRPAR